MLLLRIDRDTSSSLQAKADEMMTEQLRISLSEMQTIEVAGRNETKHLRDHVNRLAEKIQVLENGY
jgi:polyhydroxyalkanoate synthesis regulator phasin